MESTSWTWQAIFSSTFRANSRCSGTVCALVANPLLHLKARAQLMSSLAVSPVFCESSYSSLDHGVSVRLQESLKTRARSFGSDFPVQQSISQSAKDLYRRQSPVSKSNSESGGEERP